MTSMNDLREWVARFKLDDSLLYLNRVLSVSRGDSDEPQMQQDIASLSLGHNVPPFAVHLIAKHLALSASNYGWGAMGRAGFARALEIVLNLDDPIAHDASFRTANPAGFFERFLGQQIPGQNRIPIQKLGIASGLFGLDDWARPCRHQHVKRELEKVLGLELEIFIGLGLVTHALRLAKDRDGSNFQGTFGHMYLAEAYAQGFHICVPENWSPFLERVAASIEVFRAMSAEERFQGRSELYSPWEFNALTAKPILNVGGDRFLAVDPDLVIDRVTQGLFHDLFDAYGVDFIADRFGSLFEDFVGELLSPVTTDLWSTFDWENPIDRPTRKSSSKVCDWIATEKDTRVFFECKSFRPTLSLQTAGEVADVEAYALKVAKAVRQCSEHSLAVRRGDFGEFQRVDREAYVIVTYGKFHMVNSWFVRKVIDPIVKGFGIEDAHYVVLSLSELDSIVSLAERHGSITDVIWKIVSPPSETAFGPFAGDLEKCAVSSATQRRGRKALGFKGGPEADI